MWCEHSDQIKGTSKNRHERPKCKGYCAQGPEYIFEYMRILKHRYRRRSGRSGLPFRVAGGRSNLIPVYDRRNSGRDRTDESIFAC